MKKNNSVLLSTPYIIWMVLFTLIPLGVVGYYALTDPATGEFTFSNLRELGRMIGDWLRTRTPVERALFVRRYWYGERLRDLARESGQGENRLAGRMLRLRRDLRTYLELRGVEV